MTPSESIAVKLVKRPSQVLRFSLRFVWALVVLVAVCLVWLTLFVIFLPFILLSEVFGLKRRLQPSDQISDSDDASSSDAEQVFESSDNQEFVFDRRRDVSKLYGCNTRSVKYRWTIFADRLKEIRTKFAEPNALDFGAGSLRDSYELAKLGFRVVSIDLESELLESYAKAYDWTHVRRPQFFTAPFEELEAQTGPGHFQLALSFDVIEHLEDPAGYLRQLRPLLDESGLLFAIVPNRLSLFERHFKRTLKKQRSRGMPLKRGVPHLQFKSPSEWKAFFEAHGFRIVEHDMTLGFFVNDCWNGLLSVPLRVHVEPVLSQIAFRLRIRFDAEAFERFFLPAWLMERIHVLDMLLRRPLKNRFGWNLFVAQKKLKPPT